MKDHGTSTLKRPFELFDKFKINYLILALICLFQHIWKIEGNSGMESKICSNISINMHFNASVFLRMHPCVSVCSQGTTGTPQCCGNNTIAQTHAVTDTHLILIGISHRSK